MSSVNRLEKNHSFEVNTKFENSFFISWRLPTDIWNLFQFFSTHCFKPFILSFFFWVFFFMYREIFINLIVRILIFFNFFLISRLSRRSNSRLNKGLKLRTTYIIIIINKSKRLAIIVGNSFDCSQKISSKVLFRLSWEFQALKSSIDKLFSFTLAFDYNIEIIKTSSFSENNLFFTLIVNSDINCVNFLIFRHLSCHEKDS